MRRFGCSDRSGGGVVSLEPVSQRDGEGVGFKSVSAICCRALVNVSAWTVSILVSDIPAITFELPAEANRKDMSVRIRNGRIEAFVRNRVFAVKIASAHVVGAEFAGYTEFIYKTRLPVK